MNNTALQCEREDLTRAGARQFESISYTAVEKQKTVEALWDGYCVCVRDSLGFNGTGVGFDALGFVSSTHTADYGNVELLKGFFFGKTEMCERLENK